MWSKIGIPKYLKMHKSQYKFCEKRNKCDVIVISTIKKQKQKTKKKKSGWNNIKIHQMEEKKKLGER